MPAPSTDALLVLSGPYRSCVNNGVGQLIKIGLLVQIAQGVNPAADYSMNGLLLKANQYINGNCDTGLGIELGLLLIIAGY